MRSLGNANYWHKVTRTEERCSPIQTVQSVQMTDSVQLKLRQRATIMLKVCELAESHRPETDKGKKGAQTCRLLKRLLDKAHTRNPREMAGGGAASAER